METWTQGQKSGQLDIPAARNSVVLAIATAVAVASGVVLPYASSGGVDWSLSDGATSSLYIALLGPAVVAVIAPLARNTKGAAVAAGAAAGVGGLVLIIVAATFEIVNEASSSEFFGEYAYGIGFFAHVAAGVGAVALVVLSLTVVAARSSEPPVVAPAIGLIGALGLCAFGIGLVMPVDGFSILDFGGTITPAYLAFIAIVVLPGVIGFASRRGTGTALGLGASITPLCLWASDAVADEASGVGLFGGFDDGNTAVAAIGAIAAAVCGVIGLMASDTNRAPATARAHHPPAPPAPAWPAPVSREEPAVITRTDSHRLVIDVSDDVPTTDAPMVPYEPVSRSAMEADSVPSGWHPDPYQRFALRWWDGARWTEHVLDGARSAAIDEPGYG